MTKRIISLLVLSCFVWSAPSVADEKDKVSVKEDKAAIEALNDDIDEQMKIARKERKESAEKTFGKVTGMMMSLEEHEQKHFFLAYTNYNLIETVKVVQGDVKKAINKCGENNPDMKGSLDARFKAWNKAVNPLIKEAEGNYKNMLVAQDYASKKELKDIFNSVDETREKTYDQIEKIPVTTPEACQYLINKMDETEESMLSILRSTLVSAPKILEENQEAADKKAAK